MPSHAKALSEVILGDREGYRRHFDPFPFDPDSLREIIRTADGDRYWGIRWSGALVGFFMLRGFDEGYERPTFGVYIREDFSNRGLSKLAISYALAWCRLTRVSEIMLKVATENHFAHQAYEAAGFTNQGLDPVSGQRIMIKRLTEP